jgi:hypothetical protein
MIRKRGFTRPSSAATADRSITPSFSLRRWIKRLLPRDIDETPLDDPDSIEKPGYLMPEPENDDDYSFAGAPTDYP